MKSTIPFGNKPNKRGEIISGWFYDKKLLDPKLGLFKKLEVFRYFNVSELDQVINFIEKNFNPASSNQVLPKLMRLLLNYDEKVYRKNKRGVMEVFDRDNLVRANILPPDEYLYENLFMMPIVHRKARYLIRIYRLALASDNRDQIKLEVTFFDDAPKDRRGYKANRSKTAKKINAMSEIMKRFDKKFQHGEFLDHTRDRLTMVGLKRWRTKQMKGIYEKEKPMNYSSFEVGILKKLKEKR